MSRGFYFFFGHVLFDIQHACVENDLFFQVRFHSELFKEMQDKPQKHCSRKFSKRAQGIKSPPSRLCLFTPGSDGIGNWEVVDAQSPKSDSRFYLNVCHKVLQTEGAAGCPLNASICAVGKSHKNSDPFPP